MVQNYTTSNLRGAKQLVTELLAKDLKLLGKSNELDLSQVGNDASKFTLNGHIVRVINTWQGHYAPINLLWFEGRDDLPEIKGEFEWYAFAIDSRLGFSRQHYWLCSYSQMKEWVLSFDSPLGNDHRDHKEWRCGIDFRDETEEMAKAYFRWGDESPEGPFYSDRLISLNNAAEMLGGSEVGGQAGSIPQYQKRLKIEDAEDPFEPEAQNDDPQDRILQSVRRRRGQRQFRERLLKLYRNRCAFTGDGPPDVLEAAHIQPHSEKGRNSSDNGLLLRADLHTLFDIGLIWIDPTTMEIRVSPELDSSSYSSLDGAVVRRRTDGSEPSTEYLKERLPNA